ncbi:MAG: hypothetical protein VX294_11370 [Candidatus Latescibacterota bacterium]|nr:hypothetical protein [Candidatus Latescibacterota bacterium]
MDLVIRTIRLLDGRLKPAIYCRDKGHLSKLMTVGDVRALLDTFPMTHVNGAFNSVFYMVLQIHEKIDSKSSIVEANVLSGFLDGLFPNRKAMPSIDGFVMSSKALK